MIPNSIRRLFFVLATLLSVLNVNGKTNTSAVFIHPDGTGLGHWNALRHHTVGPDGYTHWDKLDRIAAYRVHQKNWLSTTSHAGATTHAYGKKVHHNSYGLDRDQPLTALSGKNMSLMVEAMASGIRVGTVNSGHLAEPGTGVFLTSNVERYDFNLIVAKILESGADLIFGGGEIYMIPKGTIGRHGEEGRREDGRNLIEEAIERGYEVIFTREELLSLQPDPDGRVLGVFSANNTYNAMNEEKLREKGLPKYNPDEPTFDEMVDVALKFLGSDPETPFFLVAEEEGTDNFSNNMNASGMLEAIRRADLAIGKVVDFMAANSEKDITLIVGADSDAGSPSIWAPKNFGADYVLPMTTKSGAQLDGVDGQGGRPFWSAPDSKGNRYPFGISWASSNDYSGSAITKAHGFLSDRLGASVDNTDIYKIFYEALFGTRPWLESAE